MTPPRFAFIKARWHADIDDEALVGFQEIVTNVDIFELPLLAQRLAPQFAAIVCAAWVVDGGIYRHDFVADAVVKGLLDVGLRTQTPILSVCLTPHQFQDTPHHIGIFQKHFRIKGTETARAALAITAVHDGLRD